jgi:N-acylneuraminate cytidylyltransferase/CMP-N,N'-diacetyllegionaminic acid synthase
MTRVATICARGGSKSVQNKNLRLLAGRPLIAWTVLQAKASAMFDKIVVSSDDRNILAAAVDAGADEAIERPAALATDTSAKIPAIHHALIEAERRYSIQFDVLVDLDATAPLRLARDITGAIALFEHSGATSVITGATAHRSPYFNLVERQADGAVRLSKPPVSAVVRRQDAPPCFDMNASIYVWRRDAFVIDPQVFYPDTRLYEMPPERSHDIDSELDFTIVEFLFMRLGIADALRGS